MLSDKCVLAENGEMRGKTLVFIEEVHGRRSDASIEIKSNQMATRVMIHNDFWTTCQMLA